jgi:phospholipid transport system substrate-binding protein
MIQRLTSFILLVVLAAAPFIGFSQDKNATEVVERLQNTLISVMKNADKLGYQGRYKQLAPVIKETHDLANIARIAVGRYWQQLDDQQKNQLIDTFSTLSIATYANRFDNYSGETFQTLSEEKPESNLAIVHVLFIEPEGEKLRFDYMLHLTREGWRIINITVEGVSDLALKRAQFTSTLRREGFNNLIAKLKDMIKENAESQS